MKITSADDTVVCGGAIIRAHSRAHIVPDFYTKVPLGVGLYGRCEVGLEAPSSHSHFLLPSAKCALSPYQEPFWALGTWEQPERTEAGAHRGPSPAPSSHLRLGSQRTASTQHFGLCHAGHTLSSPAQAGDDPE